MEAPLIPLDRILARIDAVRRPGIAPVRIVAASKQQPVAALRRLAQMGVRTFGENYVQEGRAKMAVMADLDLEWHLIGPLQSNKCKESASDFDWVQSVDRKKLVEPLARWRPADRTPLQILVQVNIDDESSKAGCTPDAAAALCAAVAAQPQLRLRGLMAIPSPDPDPAVRRLAFRRMRELFDRLRTRFDTLDTLSMGMSDDFELAIAEGATMVRLGTVLFGARPPRDQL